MKIVRNILLIALGLLVQSTLFGRMDIYGVRPDLAMLVMIFLASEVRSVEIILYGFFIGFLQDVYSPDLLGYNALTMSLMGFLLGFAREKITVENYSVRILVTIIACVTHDVIYLSLYTKFDLYLFTSLFLRVNLPGALYTSGLAVIFMTAWDWTVKGGLIFVIREILGIRR